MEKEILLPKKTITNPYKFQESKYSLVYDEPKLDDENYLKTLISQYRNEVSLLKQYISLINTEIRKNLNIETPSIEDAFKAALSEVSTDPLDENIINSWMSRLMNVEYVNPLIILYNTHINNLEGEISNLNKMMKNYEKKISNLITENKSIRDELEVRNNEFKNFLSVKIDNETGESNAVIDREYVMKLEERINTLSRENDILALNYHKAKKESFNMKYNSNETIKNANEKILSYDTLYMQYQDLCNKYDLLFHENQTNNQKLLELSENENKFSIENQNLKNEIDDYKNKVDKLNIEINYYKDLADKLSKPNSNDI